MSSLLGRIVGAFTSARTRPPTAVTAMIGAVLLGAGLTLVQRYAAHQQQLIGTYSDELDGLDRLIATRANQVSELRDEIGVLRRERLAAPDPAPTLYPVAEDLDPLHRGDQADEQAVPVG